MKKLLFLAFAGCFFFAEAQNPLMKIWDYRYGGTSFEDFRSIQQTADGGFILAGHSISQISGDKTEANRDSTAATGDFWIVKIDAAGNKQWDKTFGGTHADYLLSVQQTADHGYILGGDSRSGIGGDKSQANRDSSGNTHDYWIVKTDSSGNKIWDRDFGGTLDDRLLSIRQTSDGGYILGGYSFSAISGDKSEANWDATLSTADYWIVKTDALGNKLWDKTFGGDNFEAFFSIRQTADGGFILGGSSDSDISGDKTERNRDTVWYSNDYWILKTDSLGAKQWDKTFGGTNNEMFTSLQQTADGGFILGGLSDSDMGGDKSQPLWGPSDYWILKTDASGNKTWDKDFGGTGSDWLYDVQQTPDHGFILGGNSSSGVSGDKSEPAWGSYDYWIVKTDSLGIMQWDKDIGGFDYDWFAALAQAGNNTYVLAGYSYSDVGGDKSQPLWGGTATDYWIVKVGDSTAMPPTASFSSAGYACSGMCLDFYNYSQFATSYQWYFPGGTPDTSTAANPNICYPSAGTYDVQLVAGNSNGSDTLLFSNYITVYNPPVVFIIQSHDTLFTVPGFAAYQWYLDSSAITGATNYFYVATQSGDYSVLCSDTNGCSVEAAVLNVVAGIQAAPGRGSEQLVVFPNPVVEKLEIRNWKLEIAGAISIFNTLGEKIYSAANWLQPVVDCRFIPPGIYWLEVSNEEKFFRTKFVKQ